MLLRRHEGNQAWNLWFSLIALFSGPGEGALTLGAMVGFITLFGITMRNSIMMISHFQHLVNEEGMTWGLETALRGASEPLVLILMTALLTGLGLLPLALGSGKAGREIEGPMAIVILGGLITSTVLNLLVRPTLALRYGRFKSSIDRRFQSWLSARGKNNNPTHVHFLANLMADYTKT